MCLHLLVSCCQTFDLSKCGWKKVKNLKVGSPNWYEQDDNLEGTLDYGDSANDDNNWSVNFEID